MVLITLVAIRDVAERVHPSMIPPRPVCLHSAMVVVKTLLRALINEFDLWPVDHFQRDAWLTRSNFLSEVLVKRFLWKGSSRLTSVGRSML